MRLPQGLRAGKWSCCLPESGRRLRCLPPPSARVLTLPFVFCPPPQTTRLNAQHGGQGAPGMCIPASLGGSSLPAWLVALLIVASVVAVSRAPLAVATAGAVAPLLPVPAQSSRASSASSLLAISSLPAVGGLFAYRWRLRREMQARLACPCAQQCSTPSTPACLQRTPLHCTCCTVTVLPLQAEVHSILREYLPLGGTEGETAALGESLLPRGGGGGGTPGGSPGGARRKPFFSGGDVEGGRLGEALSPVTPASR